MPGPTAAVEVELWVRSLSPETERPRRASAIRRLETLYREGHVDGFEVSMWGDRVSRSGPDARTDAGRRILDRVTGFENWARANDASLSPFFDETESSTGGVALPTMALAEYEDGDLRFVAPCTSRRVGYTVVDRLDALEADTPSPDPVASD
jgi:hypothetical protein